MNIGLLFISALVWGGIIWRIVTTNRNRKLLYKRLTEIETQLAALNPKKEDPTEDVDQS